MSTPDEADMELYDLRVTVQEIAGRSVCGLSVGDYIELTESSRLRLPPGKHFCLHALAAALPLLPAKQRQLPAADCRLTGSSTSRRFPFTISSCSVHFLARRGRLAADPAEL